MMLVLIISEIVMLRLIKELLSNESDFIIIVSFF